MSARVNSRLEYEWNNGFLLLVAAIGVVTCVRFGADGALGMTTAFFASVMAHEMGHILAAMVNRTRVKALGFNTRGVYLRRERAQGVAEILISAAGPTVNMALACAMIHVQGRISWLATMNLLLFLLNMLPFAGSDGARILATLREGPALAVVPTTESSLK